MEKLASTLPVTMPPVMDPAGTGDNFSERYKDSWNYSNFREQLQRYADIARAAYDETDRDKSIALWRDMFGDNFKPGVLAKAAQIDPLSSSVPWDREQFIDRPPHSFPIRIDPKFSLRVSGRVTGFRAGTTHLKRGFRQFELARSGNRVPKNRNIQFRATTNVPAPYELYWKVRNGGQEAASVGELRGEISKTLGEFKNETTSYAGYHYVECYVVKNGEVVARDRQGVIVRTA